MKAPNRDLLVLVKHALDNDKAMEKELTRLHSLLLTVETAHTFGLVYEIIDCNRCKTSSNARRILKMLSSQDKPFVFLNNLN